MPWIALAAAAAVVLVVGVAVAASLMFQGASPSEPIVGTWTIDAAGVDEVRIEVKKDGTFDAQGLSGGGKFLGLGLGSSDALVRSLRWERIGADAGVNRYRVFFDGDSAGMWNAATEEALQAMGVDGDELLRRIELTLEVPEAFPSSVMGVYRLDLSANMGSELASLMMGPSAPESFTTSLEATLNSGYGVDVAFALGGGFADSEDDMISWAQEELPATGGGRGVKVVFGDNVSSVEFVPAA